MNTSFFFSIAQFEWHPFTISSAPEQANKKHIECRQSNDMFDEGEDSVLAHPCRRPLDELSLPVLWEGAGKAGRDKCASRQEEQVCPETVSSHYSAFSRLRETISLAKDRARKMSSGIGGRGSSSVALGIGSRGVSSIALGGRGLGSPLGGSTVPAASSVNLWTGNQGIGWVSYSIFCLEIHCWPVFSSPGQYIVGKCIHCFMGGGAHCAHTGTSRLQGTKGRHPWRRELLLWTMSKGGGGGFKVISELLGFF